ncbi:MAG: MBL fold metallo-hydrolase [Lachnospiraceae bacterium]|nr:MBL fold metallo-hydrolase [Lachnospiraceae bacterium]
MTTRLKHAFISALGFTLTAVLIACAGYEPVVVPEENDPQISVAESAPEPETTESDIESEMTESDTEQKIPEPDEPTSNDTEPDPTGKIMEVHFIDVGQADSTLIKLGDHAMLIDCGTDDVGTKVQYYLKNHGVDKLDYLILTHPDSDHIGGADVIITKFDIDTVFMSSFTKDNNWYEDLINALDYRKYGWNTPEVGSRYDLGDASFTIVAPNRVYTDPNNSSIALVLQYGDTRFLFTGDASEDAEADIVQNGLDISADVYKMGHHGSRSASAEDFLAKVDPKYVVISCSNGNDYGHPHEEALDRLKKYDPEIYRTDEQGTIIAYSDGKEVTWDHQPSTTWACGIQTLEEIPVIYNYITRSGYVEDTEGITYVLNTNSKRFHKPDCDSVTEMKPKNRQDVNWTRDECIREGYTPCGNCKP